MSLTRKLLESMGLESDKVSSIIDAHVETVDGLKAQIEQYKTDAEDVISRQFAKGTTALNIVDHEYAHIQNTISLQDKTVAYLTEQAHNIGITLTEYIHKNISYYAASVTQKGYSELIPEIVAKSRGTEPHMARKILKEVGFYDSE